MRKGFCLGVLASFFFAFTFILNRSMSLTGGYWMWSGPLRYAISLPVLFLILFIQGHGMRFLQETFAAIHDNLSGWLLWSTVGFGCFYLPMTLASTYGASWLTASAWQLTIVAGVLLTPLFGQKVPIKNLLISCVILVGVVLMEAQEISSDNFSGNLVALGLIIIAAFSYPLGNRKTMSICPSNLTTLQRVFGMTLCSMPFWIVVAVLAGITGGAPGTSQILQSVGVAMFSSVVATLLFFSATDLVKENARKLAAVEATQCGEVIFTLLGGILVLGDPAPGVIAWVGIIMVVGGMITHSMTKG